MFPKLIERGLKMFIKMWLIPLLEQKAVIMSGRILLSRNMAFSIRFLIWLRLMVFLSTVALRDNLFYLEKAELFLPLACFSFMLRRELDDWGVLGPPLGYIACLLLKSLPYLNRRLAPSPKTFFPFLPNSASGYSFLL